MNLNLFLVDKQQLSSGDKSTIPSDLVINSNNNNESQVCCCNLKLEVVSDTKIPNEDDKIIKHSEPNSENEYKSEIKESNYIQMPKPATVKFDKKRYDREFLMSMRSLATDKPKNLPKIKDVIIEDVRNKKISYF